MMSTENISYEGKSTQTHIQRRIFYSHEFFCCDFKIFLKYSALLGWTSGLLCTPSKTAPQGGGVFRHRETAEVGFTTVLRKHARFGPMAGYGGIPHPARRASQAWKQSHELRHGGGTQWDMNVCWSGELEGHGEPQRGEVACRPFGQAQNRNLGKYHLLSFNVYEFNMESRWTPNHF